MNVLWIGLFLGPVPLDVEMSSDIELLNQAEAAFSRGLQLHDKPNQSQPLFREAAEDYEELHCRGARNVALLRNQGNAYLLAEDLPRAIRAYRRGLRLDPGDRLLGEHLAFARDQVVYSSSSDFARPIKETWSPILRDWLLLLCAGLGLVLYSLGWLGLTRWRMTRGRGLLLAGLSFFTAAGFSGALAATFLVVEIGQQRYEERHPLVVINDDNVLLRNGNGLAYPARYDTPLQRGVEARLLFERGDWLQIELSGGAVGWVPREYALVDECSRQEVAFILK